MIGPISGIVLFEVVYINKWNTPQEAASWLHEPASMYEVIPSKPISTEEFTAKQLQWECMKANQALGLCELGFDLSRVWSWGTESDRLVGLALDLCKELDSSYHQDLEV